MPIRAPIRGIFLLTKVLKMLTLAELLSLFYRGSNRMNVGLDGLAEEGDRIRFNPLCMVPGKRLLGNIGFLTRFIPVGTLRYCFHSYPTP